MYTSFSTEIRVSGKAMQKDSVFFRYPFRIRHKDNRLIVLDLHHPDYFYHLYSFPGFEYLYSFGKRGQGPGEILSAENFRFANDSIWMLDANKHLLAKGSVQDRVNLNHPMEVPLDKDIIRALDFALYNDSCFIIPDYSGQHRFHIVHKDGSILSSHGEIPSQEHSERNMALAQAWRSFIDYNPKNHILAMATQLGEVLEIYNFEDSTHIVKVGPHGEPEFQTAQGMAIPSGIMGFSDVQVTDHYIYCVFHGRSFKEIVHQKPPVIDGGKYIYVFSLKGEPVCQYTLDHYIYGIDVNEDSKEIFAVDVNSDQPIIQYNITHL
jgi:hypothetical protein